MTHIWIFLFFWGGGSFAAERREEWQGRGKRKKGRKKEGRGRKWRKLET